MSDQLIKQINASTLEFPHLGLRLRVIASGRVFEGTVITAEEYSEGVLTVLKGLQPPEHPAGSALFEQEREKLVASLKEDAAGNLSYIHLKQVEVDGGQKIDRLKLPLAQIVGYSPKEPAKPPQDWGQSKHSR